jgi:hypothetical protein
MSPRESAPQTPVNPTYACPWCPYTADRLKPVLLHMESAHRQAWCDLILYPPIAGGVY